MSNIDQLKLVVKRIRDSVHQTEEDEERDIELLEKLSPDPMALDYCTQKEYNEWTDEEIIEKILSYQPIKL